jgi:hypothetical protein
MRVDRRPCLLWAATLAFAGAAASAWAAGEEPPIPVPTPPLVQPLVQRTVKARPDASPAWVRYQEGRRLFEDQRLGEALVAFRQATELRREQFTTAGRRIDDVLGWREAKEAKNSLQALIAALASRDVIEREYEAIRKKAAGSLVDEISLLFEHRLSDPVYGFLDAVRLVLDHRGPARIADSIAELRASAASLVSFPEAEYWIGKVYLAEGEVRLAELQMLKAWDSREALEVLEEGIIILEDLASMYRTQERLGDYELKLREITESTRLFSKSDEYLRQAMERTLARDGFDKFMQLYRIDELYARKACSELGALYLEGGRPRAVIFLAAAVNTGLTRAIGALKASDPGYAFANLSEFLSKARSERSVSAFIADSGIYRDLYLLGEALAAQGDRDTARGIWRVVSGISGIEPWNLQADRALRRPVGAPLPYPSVVPARAP